MNLENLFDLLALQLGADANELIRYAAEDTLGGYHINPQYRKWDTGSLWESEGKVLYALVRYLRPALVVEIGSMWGCSTSHLAAACKANGSGSVVSIDMNVHGIEVGNAIPAELRPLIQQISARGEDWLAKQSPDSGIGLVFEDADHTTQTTADLSRLALEVLEPGGVLVNHDAMHDLAILGDYSRTPVGEGKAIRRGLEIARADFRTYITDESDCGISVTVKAKPVAYPEGSTTKWDGVYNIPEAVEKRKNDEFVTADGDVLEVVETTAETDSLPVEKPKRKRTPKAKK